MQWRKSEKQLKFTGWKKCALIYVGKQQWKGENKRMINWIMNPIGTKKRCRFHVCGTQCDATVCISDERGTNGVLHNRPVHCMKNRKSQIDWERDRRRGEEWEMERETAQWSISFRLIHLAATWGTIGRSNVRPIVFVCAFHIHMQIAGKCNIGVRLHMLEVCSQFGVVHNVTRPAATWAKWSDEQPQHRAQSSKPIERTTVYVWQIRKTCYPPVN